MCVRACATLAPGSPQGRPRGLGAAAANTAEPNNAEAQPRVRFGFACCCSHAGPMRRSGRMRASFDDPIRPRDNHRRFARQYGEARLILTLAWGLKPRKPKRRYKPEKKLQIAWPA